MEAALIRLARAAVEAEVAGKRLAAPRKSRSRPQPVFVTIERRGQVVGCRGALECRTRSLEEEVVLAARAAAAHDPRYRPLSPRDLAGGFQVTVTLVQELRPLEPSRVDTLSPAEGLVLKANGRTGIVLPWEGKAPRVRLEWAYKKAGIRPGAPCTLHLLIADRFRG